MVYQNGNLCYVNQNYHVDENENICFDFNKKVVDGVTTKDREISIAWRNLQYEVKELPSLKNLKWSKKTILRCLNGSFALNSLNGLMGPSGAVCLFYFFCLIKTYFFANKTRASQRFLIF